MSKNFAIELGKFSVNVWMENLRLCANNYTIYGKLLNINLEACVCARAGGTCHLICSVSNQPVVGCGHIVHRDGEADGQC